MDYEKKGRGNPLGKPRLPAELSLAKKLSKEFVRVKLTEMLQKPMHELVDICQDYDMNAIDCWLAKIIVMGVTTGDQVRLNFMFDRIIGKVSEVKEIQINKPFRVESLAGDRTIELGMTNHEEI